MNNGLKTKAMKISFAVSAVLMTSLLPARADGAADHQERRYVHIIDGGGPGCMALTEDKPNYNGGCFNVPAGATTISLSLKDDFESITGAKDSRAFIHILTEAGAVHDVDVCSLPQDLSLPEGARQVVVQLDNWATTCGQLLPPRVIAGTLSADFGH